MAPGGAIIHAGELRHRASPVIGRRHNLILWGMSSHTRNAVSPGSWETELIPSAECVSANADSDACEWDTDACGAGLKAPGRATHSYPEDL
jgi:hypothetical protein